MGCGNLVTVSYHSTRYLEFPSRQRVGRSVSPGYCRSAQRLVLGLCFGQFRSDALLSYGALEFNEHFHHLKHRLAVLPPRAGPKDAEDIQVGAVQTSPKAEGSAAGRRSRC